MSQSSEYYLRDVKRIKQVNIFGNIQQTFKNFIYLFLERREGGKKRERERERERNISVREKH